MAIKRLMCLIFIFGLVLSTTGVAEVSKKQQSNMRFRPGKRNKVRDISIVQLRIEPTQFKIGDRVHALVNVANRSQISVNNVSIELKVRGAPSGRRNIATIAPGQTVEVDFGWLISRRKSELIEIAAIIKSAQMEKRPKGKIKKVRYNYLYDAEGDVGILYKVEPPVHQWIAFQAYNKLPSADLKSEMSSYLPTSSSDPNYSSSFSPPSGWYSDDDAPYIGSTALIEGAWEEDQGDFDPILGKPWRYVSHFWDPDESYDKGLDLSWWGFGQMPSSLEAAQVHFYEAVSNYSSGNKDLAYYYLGRTAHLLMDMSIPAHTLMDVHWPDDDQYEEYTATGTNYKDILSSSTNTNIPDITGLDPYPLYTPSGFNDGLTKLLYNLTELSDNFDSDDSGETQYGISIPYGESYEFGQGKYTLARISLNSSKVFDRAEWWGPWPFGGKERDLYQYGENGPYIDYDIFDGCGEYHMYVYFSLWDELNNTLDRIRVIYTDGSDDFVTNWDDIYDVPDSVLECIYQPRLEAWAIGYVAALYQLFWDSVEHPDTDPPTPSPMTWATEPYQTSTSSISMVATVASDPSTPIYYQFDFYDNPTGGSGGTDSGWQTGRTYTDSGLQTNHQYGYRVRAKDSAPAQNTTDYSSVSYDYTDIERPSGITFGNITSTSIQAKSSNLPSGLDRDSSALIIYNATIGTDSGWKQNNEYWNSSSLSVNAQYGFKAMARNGDGVETDYCSTQYKYTLANAPGTASFSNVTTDSIQANWTANGNPSGTEYYCENITNDLNSGWITETYWNCSGIDSAKGYFFQVKARNGDTIETVWTDLGSTHTLATDPSPSPFSGVDCNNIQANWDVNGNSGEAEYFCENITEGTNSGWINDTFWNSTGLSLTTEYSFRVKVRNGDGIETGMWIDLGSETTHVPPVISNASPASGPYKTCMTIEGQNFYDWGSVVFPGGLTADILQWTDTQIYCRVPYGTVSGDFTVNRGIDSNPLSFTITDPNIIYVDLNYTANIETGTTEYPFGKIQYGIDAADPNDEVVVADGIYTGDGNRDIYLDGSIKVYSENGPDNCIIDCNGSDIDPHIGFNINIGTAELDGFTIINGYTNSNGGGIRCHGNAKISNCILRDNYAKYGGGISVGPEPLVVEWRTLSVFSHCQYWTILAPVFNARVTEIDNCIITNNSAIYGGGIHHWIVSIDTNEAFVGALIQNSTIAANSASYGGGIACYNNMSGGRLPDTFITNTIVWDNNDRNGSQIYYSTESRFYHTHAGSSTVYEGVLNLENYSSLIVNYSDIQGGQEEVYDPNNNLIWDNGNIDADPCFFNPGYLDPNGTPNDPNDDFWANGDYHLQSEAGRWDTNQSNWVIDSNTSPCIDAGNPGSPLGDEPNDPNNIRINMGAYGGTAEASKTPASWSLLADLTNDGTVDFMDFAVQAKDWQNIGIEQPGDLYIDDIIDIIDLSLLAEDWLRQTSWAQP